MCVFLSFFLCFSLRIFLCVFTFVNQTNTRSLTIGHRSGVHQSMEDMDIKYYTNNHIMNTVHYIKYCTLKKVEVEPRNTR